MAAAPGFVTHYHLAGRAPFLNLCELDPPQLEQVMAGLGELGRAGRSQRRFGPRYLRLRRDTEALLRERFIARGGRPSRDSPHYFVLGRSRWFQGLYRDCAEVRLALADLPAEATSLTWPDSIASMGLLASYGIDQPGKPQYGRVFLLSEHEQLVAEYGLPDPAPPVDYAGHQREPFDHFIEVQLWSDVPLRRAGLVG